jgi:hypothetical protein
LTFKLNLLPQMTVPFVMLGSFVCYLFLDQSNLRNRILS